MAWTRYTHASVSATHPRPLGTCDRCGMVYNRDHLAWQHDWRGPRIQNLRILVCPTCTDLPQQSGQRVIILPPDPVPIMNPRPDPHMFMGQSSSPDPYQSGSPNTIATNSDDPIASQDIVTYPPVTVTGFLTSTSVSPWTVPENTTSLDVELIGAGAGGRGGYGTFVLPFGGSGGGAGGYAKKSAIAVTPSDTLNFGIGSMGVGGAIETNGTSGGDTWFGGTNFADALVSATGGTAGSSIAGGTGGTGISGDVLYTGGNGGVNVVTNTHGAGGGGAAGQNGDGAVGTIGSSGSGGAGDAGFGGAGGMNGATPNGNPGTEFDATHGSGGGGGGSFGAGVTGGNGGAYGAGGGGGVAITGQGGNGSDGIIMITYTYTPTPSVQILSPLITEIGITPTPTSSGYT